MDEAGGNRRRRRGGAAAPISTRARRSHLIRIILRMEGKLHPRLYGWLVRAAWPLIRDGSGFVSVARAGSTMYLDLREAAERQTYLDAYDPSLSGFLRGFLRRGDAFVDVGANHGPFSFLALEEVGPSGTVIAIEPNPSLAARLKRSAIQNPVLSVVECAVSDERGTATFYLSSSHPYSTLIESELPDYPSAGTCTVEVLPLDEIEEVNAFVDRSVRALKIDIQGFESAAVRGAGQLLGRTDGVILEKMGPGLDRAHALLEAAGFAANLIDANGLVSLSNLGEAPDGSNLIYLRPESD